MKPHILPRNGLALTQQLFYVSPKRFCFTPTCLVF
jgi:hypothetical protein